MEGNLDILKDCLLHRTQILHARSVRFIPSLGSIFGFKAGFADFKPAYLESVVAHKCAIQIENPAQELKLEPNECVMLHMA